MTVKLMICCSLIAVFWSSKFIVAATTASQFALWEPEKIVETLVLWNTKYRNLIKVSTAQHRYGLNESGTKADCAFEGVEHGCLNHFFTIQDYIAHPIGSKSAVSLPEILWTGSMYGDQKFGPTVVMEAASLLLEAATCESKPNLGHVNTPTDWDREIKEAKTCRSELKLKGIDEPYRQWLARLVSTRKIVIVPMPNSLGHYQQTRLDGNIDPWNDFPYKNKSSDSCMRTNTARTINELFLDHVFQIVLSFREGESDRIDFSWGRSEQSLAPDYNTLHDVAESLSRTIGGESKYSFASINRDDDLVDFPEKNFQEWAYAVSWDNFTKPVQCAPEEKNFGHYDRSRTNYDAKSNRAVALAVSTHVTKADNLGSVESVFHSKDNANNLHVARNMRLAFVSADLVQPYVSIFGINNISISDDIVPMNQGCGNICDKSRIVAVPHSTGAFVVEFTVGGGLDIDNTDIWIVREKDIKDSSVCFEDIYKGFEQLKESFIKYPIEKTEKTGTGFFSRYGPKPSPLYSVSKPFSRLTSTLQNSHVSISITDSNLMGGLRDIIKNTENDHYGAYGTRSINLLGPVFRTEINLNDYDAGDRLIVIARASVDQRWREPPFNGDNQSSVPPQSHLANIRTNPEYKYTKDGQVTEGRVNWLSIPVTVVIDNDVDEALGGIELYKRFDPDSGYAKPLDRPKSLFHDNNVDINLSQQLSLTIWIVLGISIAISFVFIVCCCFAIMTGRTRFIRHRSNNIEPLSKSNKSDGVFNVTTELGEGLSGYNFSDVNEKAVASMYNGDMFDVEV